MNYSDANLPHKSHIITYKNKRSTNGDKCLSQKLLQILAANNPVTRKFPCIEKSVTKIAFKGKLKIIPFIRPELLTNKFLKEKDFDNFLIQYPVSIDQVHLLSVVINETCNFFSTNIIDLLFRIGVVLLLI